MKIEEITEICEWKVITNSMWFPEIDHNLGYLTSDFVYNCFDCDGRQVDCIGYYKNGYGKGRNKIDKYNK